MIDAVEFIETNLRGELDVATVARAIGYSESRFAHLFRAEYGIAPGEYIRRRRLTEIVRAHIDRGEAISLIAFEYGFNSRESFLRAFRAENAILPSEYRAVRSSLRLTERLDAVRDELTLAPIICELERFTVAAYKSDEPIPPRFWNKYNAHGYSRRLSGGADVDDIGISHWNHGENRLDYFIGIDRRDAHGELIGTVDIELGGRFYAAFDTPACDETSFVGKIRQCWDSIDRSLESSRLVRAQGDEFEIYRESSRTFTERIFIPIKYKENLHGT